MLEYKKIGVTDLPFLAKLYAETFNSQPWNEQWTTENAEKRLHQTISVEDFFGLCAYYENDLCGAVLGCAQQHYNGIIFEIKEFFVKNGLRGRGIGTEIFKHYETCVKKMGINELILLTARGEFTEHFYHKQGFHNIDAITLMGKNL